MLKNGYLQCQKNVNAVVKNLITVIRSAIVLYQYSEDLGH